MFLNQFQYQMEFSDDTTPSVARKFINEVKSAIVTLQRVFKQKMTLDIHNWSSSIHQEIHKIVKDEIFPIVKQVDARVQIFEIQFLKEAVKFVRDFKSLTKESDDSLAKHKALELEIERLLRAVVSQDIMSIVQNNSVVDTSNLRIELKRTKEHFENCIIKKENEYAKLWNDWHKKCEECKYDKILYDKAYNDMEQKIKRLQAQLGDQKGVNITTKTKRPQPRSNTKNDRVPSTSKSSCIKNKEVEVEEHHRNLLLSRKKKHMSSECYNIKLVIRNAKTKVVYAMYKQCLITANHDVCVLNYVNGMNSRGKTQKENVSNTKNQKKQKLAVKKPRKVDSRERLASPTPSEHSICRRWSPTRRILDCNGKIIKFRASKGQSDNCNGDNACNSNPPEPFSKRFPNPTSFLGRVYFVEDLRHNLFSVGQFCDLDLGVAFRRNTCFVRNLKRVDLLKGNRTRNLYTINLHEMASASPICLMNRATYTKSWLWHQRLSHLNFDTINDLAKNDLVTGLPKFKYQKEHLCPSCEQGKKQMGISPTQTSSKFQAEVTPSSYEFVWSNENRKHKQKACWHIPPSIFCRTPQQNGVVEQRNRTLVEAARKMLIFSHAPLFLWAEAIATLCYTQNRSIIHLRFDETPYELINGKKPDFSFLYVFGALCYPKNDREDIGKLGAKGLDLTYASSTITTQQPTERELYLLFEAMYDDYIGGQPSAAPRTVPDAQVPQVLQTPTTSTIIADTAPTPTNSSS
ncbi:retrovirus-related pol polyprotein from transposon TNT 1-94 [Tanacetum coccineum]